MNLIQNISSHSDAQKRKTKKCSYIAMAENSLNTDLNTSLNLVHFVKYKTFLVSSSANILLVHEQNVFVAVRTYNNI
jgi:hypothetical protein